MSSLFTDDFPITRTERELFDLKIQYPDYDECYVSCGFSLEFKKTFDDLYVDFEPFADSHFLKEVKLNFYPRTWEMYCTVILHRAGLNIGSADQDPDIRIGTNSAPIWVECIVPASGLGLDAVPPLVYGEFRTIPSEQMLLRLSAALKAKFEVYEAYLQKGIVLGDDPFVIAVNRGNFPHPDTDMPLIMKCLFGIGELTYSFVIGKPEPQEIYYAKRDLLHKKNQSDVPMTFFDDPAHAGISAVIYSKTDVLNQVQDRLGGDCVLIRNPLAKNPLPPNLFPFFEEWAIRDNQVQKLN